MSASPEPVGARLRRLRSERGLSQRALSAPGVSYAYISRIEAGSRTPSVKALRVLARKLGVSPEYLETGSDLTAAEERELRLRNAELQLRLAQDEDAALPVLRELEQETETAGDPIVALRVKGLLTLATELRGDRASVIRELEPAVLGKRLSPVDHWSLYAMLGRAYVAAGRADEAATMFRGCLEDVAQAAPDDDGVWARTATMLAVALAEAGKLSEAQETAAAALRRSGSSGDPLARVQSHWSYAQKALHDHRPRVALESLRRAVTLLGETEDTRELARAHLSWAEIFTSEGRPEQAEEHLTLAERLLGTSPSREDDARLRIERSRMATARGDSESGMALAAAALELLGERDGDAEWALGEAQLSAGRTEDGIGSLQGALDFFETASDWPRAAAVSRKLARVLREAGRDDEALNVLERAVGYTTLADGTASRPGTRER